MSLCQNMWLAYGLANQVISDLLYFQGSVIIVIMVARVPLSMTP